MSASLIRTCGVQVHDQLCEHQRGCSMCLWARASVRTWVHVSTVCTRAEEYRPQMDLKIAHPSRPCSWASTPVSQCPWTPLEIHLGTHLSVLMTLGFLEFVHTHIQAHPSTSMVSFTPWYCLFKQCLSSSMDSEHLEGRAQAGPPPNSPSLSPAST